ncbi:Putative Zn-dependent protease, contains TPR repeats [Desulfonatronum thiosulfatophilum]|uniref:Putative Zn-dependent protease, contains TPR repeats n=1 Tax=Desulfonatronum thiosulfatophilum TaxID=617002 RepID=A0A1G6EDT1_9BACT|nr:M48 family metalloprotease [Desulfonatronum thiosulfatophilum]SDB55542.1 Putative Zn-dependent protease, contains TPR repeats [Desulfonatronum thiosulfatophilum]
MTTLGSFFHLFVSNFHLRRDEDQQVNNESAFFRLRIGAHCFAIFLLILSLLLLPQAASAQLSLGRFTISDEVELGRKFNILIRSRLPMVEDPEILEYVQGILERLNQQMPPQPFPVQIGVIRHGALNAFAGPGGHIFVHTGLLQHLENESEFAGVVAHELAHVSQRHIARRIEKAQFVNLATLLGVLASVFLGGDAQSALLYGSVAAGQSAMLSYSREDEREADQVGMNYLIAAGLRPQGMVHSFETIRKLRWLGGSAPLYLSTHPGIDERIGSMKDRVDRLPAHIREREENNDNYLRARMLVMARYTEPDQALAFFRGRELGSCLDDLGLAIALDRGNQTAEAQAAYERALACSPNDPLILREAGVFFLRLGNFDESARRLQEAVLRNPRDLMALFHYARLQIAVNQEDEAIKLLERILKHLPEQSSVHALLGRVLGQTGRLFSAHTHLAYAAIYSGDKKQAGFHMARAEEHARSTQEKSELEKIREILKEREELMR